MWFWNVLDSMNQQDLALFVQYVTGTSKVPVGGFKSLQGMNGPQKFQIPVLLSAMRRWKL